MRWGSCGQERNLDKQATCPRGPLLAGPFGGRLIQVLPVVQFDYRLPEHQSSREGDAAGFCPPGPELQSVSLASHAYRAHMHAMPSDMSYCRMEGRKGQAFASGRLWT